MAAKVLDTDSHNKENLINRLTEEFSQLKGKQGGWYEFPFLNGMYRLSGDANRVSQVFL